MSKPVNKTMIGAFVLGGVVLVVAAIMVFGSGKFFKKKNQYVLFFSGSVKGLNVGSPVMFRGVKIGTVTNMKLSFDPKSLSAVIPVYVEIDPDNFDVPEEGKTLGKAGRYKYLKPLIERGLKAQLQTQSFVTGQLMVNVDFYPDKPVRLVGLDKEYPEVPTIPTSLEQVSKTLENLDLQALYDKFMLSVEGVERLVNSPDLSGGLRSMNRTLESTDRLAKKIDEQIDPTMEHVQATAEAVKNTFAQADKAMSSEDGVPAEIKDTMGAMRETLKEVNNTLASFQTMVRSNTIVGYEIKDALKELRVSARSMRALADYLERHPEALLRGKKD